MKSYQPKSADFVEMVRESLRQELSDAVAKKLTDEFVNDFRCRIEPLISDATKEITLDKIELFRDLLSFRDELSISINGIYTSNE